MLRRERVSLSAEMGFSRSDFPFPLRFSGDSYLGSEGGRRFLKSYSRLRAEIFEMLKLSVMQTMNLAKERK